MSIWSKRLVWIKLRKDENESKKKKTGVINEFLMGKWISTTKISRLPRGCFEEKNLSFEQETNNNFAFFLFNISFVVVVIVSIPSFRRQEKPPLWDSFQDPPPQKDTGSSATWNKLNFFLKAFKLLTYFFVCFAILGCTLLSKSLYLLMASNVRPRNCTYCNSRGEYNLCSIHKAYFRQQIVFWIVDKENSSYSVAISEVDNIAWTWALIFAFSAPEVFTFLRATRICVFKDVKYLSLSESILVS